MKVTLQPISDAKMNMHGLNNASTSLGRPPGQGRKIWGHVYLSPSPLFLSLPSEGLIVTV